MDKIITAGKYGVMVKNGHFSEALSCLQAILVLEKCMGKKLPGHRVEAAKLTCSQREYRKLEKQLQEAGGWIKFLPSNGSAGPQAIVVAPSLAALGIADAKMLEPGEIALCLQNGRKRSA